MDAQFVRNLSLEDLHRARAQAIADINDDGTPCKCQIEKE